jgi:hypothetical protein
VVFSVTLEDSQAQRCSAFASPMQIVPAVVATLHYASEVKLLRR